MKSLIVATLLAFVATISLFSSSTVVEAFAPSSAITRRFAVMVPSVKYHVNVNSKLFVSMTPDQQQADESDEEKPISQVDESVEKKTEEGISNPLFAVWDDIQLNEDPSVDLALKAGAALVGILLALQGTMMFLTMLGTMASSAVSGLGAEVGRESLNLLSFFGSLLLALAQLVWQLLQVVIPALGQAAVAGFNAAAPVVSEATSNAIDAATPYVQEASNQLGQAAAPYVDSAASQLDATLQQVSSSVDTSVVKPLKEATDATLVAPVKEATDSLSQQANSLLNNIPKVF